MGMIETMKLFEVTNGYTAESYLRVLVIAQDEQRALEVAAQKYGNEGEDHKNIQAVELCVDTSKQWCNSVIDG